MKVLEVESISDGNEQITCAEDLYKINDVDPTNKELIELVTIPEIYGTFSEKFTEMYEEQDNTNPRPNDPIYAEFYRKKHTLFTTPYVKRGVLLKYPLNNETTVEEVNSYFVELAKTFSEQKTNKNGFKIIR